MSSPIRLLHLIHAFAVGGGEKFALGLVRNLSRERFATHIAVLRNFGGASLHDDFASLGLPLADMRARRLYDPQALMRLVAYLRAERIEVIHTHMLDADFHGRLAARIVGIPVISTLQNEPRSFNVHRIDRRLAESLTARFLTTRLVPVSHTLRRQFEQEWHLPPERMQVIYNGVALDEMLRLSPELPAADQPPLITTIGRLHQQKAQHLLIEAAALILPQCPQARFLIVGEGALEGQLRQHAEQLGLGDRITFTGVRRDIPEILQQTTIFALPSLWEGLPLVAVEAMAAARPVVLTSVGGNAELVQDGQSGLVVPPGDVPALADAIVGLIRDPQRRAALGLAARAQVQTEFSIATITRRYEQLYEELAGASARRLPAASEVRP